MKAEEFVKLHADDTKGYCVCIIDKKGNIFECPKGHLEALFDLDGVHDTLSSIPDNVSPLFYMIEKTGVVVVDYENQVYDHDLTQEQRYALITLGDHHMILTNPKNIHANIYL